MPDLDDPEFSQAKYASYRILCADLAPRLPREHFRRGDVYMEAGQIRISLGRMAPLHDRIIWLPTLADWLEMLKEAGVAGVDFYFEPPGASIHRYGKHAATGRELALLIRLHEAKPSSLEEAAARLWMAVTGATPAKRS